MTTNTQAFDRARTVIPGGVDSPVRAFGSVGGTPPFIASASGPSVTDIEGRTYVDLVCSWGPALLGHAHPEVVAAVQEAAARGLSFGAPTEAEVDLAEAIRERVPHAQKVRLVSTGTEATMTSVRLARGVTGRDLIVKFAGCYHGHVDALLAAAGSGVATFAVPGSPGIPEAVTGQTLVLPYNDVEALEAAFAEHEERIAAVITEAAPANMGVIAPKDGFNAAIRRITQRHGALMISDEVLTGFRTHASGYWGYEHETAGSEPWTPDLTTFGKVVGGGMPLAALGGPAQIMDQLAPMGPVYQAGTLSGNPLATAAGLATLRLADEEVYAHINRISEQVSSAASEALTREGVAHTVNRASNLFSIFFTEGPVENFAQASAQQSFRYPAFFHAMLGAGITMPPSVFEAWFLSSAHDEGAVARILEALPAAAKAAAEAKPA